ncbi:M64 family metallopeptidase [Paenibacillus sp. sgz500958]|uniref:M64 family metallopeptidase n=1 Tax=Paenibacillus sp. sgz500958 TaxID=3242475 RepID=UPI0036D3C287
MIRYLRRSKSSFILLVIVLLGFIVQPVPCVYGAAAGRSMVWKADAAIKESSSNDGTVSGKYSATLVNDTFLKSVATGKELPSKTYTVKGLPQGVKVKLVKAGSSKVSVIFSGKASSHTASDNITSSSNTIVLMFNDSAFTLGKAKQVSNYSYSKFSVVFLNPAVQAQKYTVSGTIVGVEAADQVFLVKASVQLRNSKGNRVGLPVTVNPQNGDFILKDIAPGRGYTIEVTMNGYNQETITGFDILDNIFGKDILLKKKFDFEQQKIVDNGDDDDKLVIVFVGDGYTKDEQEKFNADADKMVAAFLKEEPFKSLSEHINFYRINVISNVTGASPDPEHIKDTFFGTAYNTSGMDRLLAPTKYDVLDDLLTSSNINYDSAVIIVNSEKYGGSGGMYPTASVHASSTEIMLHEFGHSYADLGDEYYAGKIYTSESANVTQESDPKKVKWKDFIGKSNIGVYPMPSTTGWYIPTLDCKMRVLNKPFCPVCEEEIRERILAEATKKAA